MARAERWRTITYERGERKCEFELYDREIGYMKPCDRPAVGTYGRAALCEEHLVYVAATYKQNIEERQ